MRHLAPVEVQLVAHELLRRDHKGKVATGDVHFAERGDAHPGDGRLAGGLQHVIEVVVDAQEIIGDLIQHGRKGIGVIDQVPQQRFGAAQRGQDIHAAVQVAVPHQELALAVLQADARQAFELLQVRVVPVEHERLVVVLEQRQGPGGDVTEFDADNRRMRPTPPGQGSARTRGRFRPGNASRGPGS